MSERPEVLLATVLFRWFNRIETGETLFLQPDMLDGRTAWESFLRHHRAGRTAHGVSILRTALKKQGPPWITGSYIVNTHGKYGDGKSKLDGVLAQFRAFAEQSDWERRVEYFSEDKTLREFCEWLQNFYGMGGFMAYEVTSDLRWTRILREAPDINSWANPGLGAKRGASRVLQRGQRPGREGKRPKPARISDAEALEVMQHLHINHGIYWPREWPRWEMREVEHTLCEFDKYERVRLGEGTPRRLFDGGVT